MKKSWILKKGFVGILLIVPFLVFLSSGIAYADRWAISYGSGQNDQAYSVQQTSDGGYIVAGVTNSSGSSDAWVLRLNPNGTVKWQKTYGSDQSDQAYSVQQTSDGGYIVAGVTNSFGEGGNDVWILKLNPNGSMKWQKTYGSDQSDQAYSVQQTSDGGYIVAGVTYSFGAKDGDFWVLKLNGSGNVGPSLAGTWQKSYDVGMNDMAYSIQQTSDGGYIVAGVTKSAPSAPEDILVLELSANGSVKWQKTYGGVNADLARSIKQTSDGGYIVAGETSSFGAGNSDLWVLKLDGDGNIGSTGTWQKTYGGNNADLAHSIQQTSDGGYVVAGRTKSFGAGDSDFWVLRLNTDGTVKWEKTYGGDAVDLARSIQQTLDGGYIVAGETDSFGAGNSDFWVLRLDKNGEIPDCSAMGTSTATVNDTSVTADDTTAIKLSTTVSWKISTASVADTDATPDEVCYYEESDLVVSSFEVPFSVSKGVAFNVTDTTENIGSAGAGTITTTSFYLSKDNILDNSDTLIGSRSNVPDLGAGESDTDTTAVTIPLDKPLGNYYIIAKADDPDDVIENIENNNTHVKFVTIVKLTLLEPNGGEVIPSGGHWAICWNAPISWNTPIIEDDTTTYEVKYTLEYSTDDGDNWNPIKTVTGLSCTKWEVPVVSGNKNKCRVRVTALNSDDDEIGNDMSNKPFTIEVLRVTSPNGGETLTAGVSWNIEWSTNKTISPVAKTILQYTTDGTTWKPIKTLSGNPGNYDWEVFSDPSATCKVKVTLKDKDGNTIGTDVSNKVFTIQL